MEAENKWFTWKSGADCIARWRRQPAPLDLRRDIPHPSPFWTPPSEDPYYIKKWADWRKRMAEEAPPPELQPTSIEPVVSISTVRKTRGMR